MRLYSRVLFVSIALLCCIASCIDGSTELVMHCAKTRLAGCKKKFTLTSPAFVNGRTIPVKYTCDGIDISPPLVWCNPPARTKSFALIVDDPDAPGKVFVHWLLFDIPAYTTMLLPHTTRGLFISGRTDFNYKKNCIWQYGGPCPPVGGAHHYHFKLYALDVCTLFLDQNAHKKDVLKAMDGHILGEAVLTGLYQRSA